MTHIIDGKQHAAQWRAHIRQQVATLATAPVLAVILVGDDAASQVYVGAKGKACAEVGIDTRQITLPSHTTQSELLAHINQLNHDAAVSGILVQLPLPAHINSNVVLQAIDWRKDVDGFHPMNAGRLMIDEPHLVPCTPAGCMHLIQQVESDIQGAHAVVVGRSNIVGKPLSLLLLQAGCTVTIAHSRTKDLNAVCRSADILAVAVGKPHLITEEGIKPQAIVIDVGINRITLPNGKTQLQGDVHTEAAMGIARAITPVPGGVGPMTVAYLLHNTLHAAKRFAQ